jgi:hypothetical protein
MTSQQRGEHGAGAAADVDHGADSVPAAGQLDVVVRGTVPGGSHERVEIGRDVGVRGEVLPERAAEYLLVGGLAGSRCLLLEDALGHQVAEDGVQDVPVAAGRRGQVGEVMAAFGEEVRDPQGGGGHQAPGRGQVER